jgi:O-antigen/teichoic acid export membrane protein
VRSALVRYSAYFHARGEFDKLNELINTVIGYYTAITSVAVLIALILSRYADRLFHVPPEYQQDVPVLLIVVGVAAILGINVFAATLEGLQCFDIGTRVYLLTIGIRSIGTFLLLYFGYGLVALGLNIIVAQIAGYIGAYRGFRRIFPELRLSVRLVRISMLRHIASYAIHTFLASIATQMLNQTPALLIGFFRPAAFIGYYSFPLRMVQYALDFVMRVGHVSASRAAELSAKGRFREVLSLAEYSNRYCLTMFLPLSIFLLPYGYPLIAVWVGRDFATYSAPIIPIVLLSITTAYVAQFNSSSILFGMGKHHRYSHGLLVEAAINLPGMFLLIPRYGIMGAAWAAAVPMILVRGIFTPYLVTYYLGGSYAEYMRRIFLAPLATAAPVIALGYYLRDHLLPGKNWFQLIAAGGLITAAYWSLALFTSIAPEHRSRLFARARGLLQTARATAQA